MRDPKKNQECLVMYKKLLPRVSDYVDKYAAERADDIAIVEYNTAEEISWYDFSTSTKAFAAKLLDMGLKKGDVVATLLPLLKEHVYLMYACFRIGVIIAPLDLRLKTREIDRALTQIKPKAFFFLGKTSVTDFRPMVAEVMDNHEECKFWIQFDVLPNLIIKGAMSIRVFASDIQKIYIGSLLTGTVKSAMNLVSTRDPCLIIFTTGSTGWPKPAVICHENILIQNIGLQVAFEITQDDKMLINVHPSSIIGISIQLSTSIFLGLTSVIIPLFNPINSLDAIQKYKVTHLFQTSEMYKMEWDLSNYKKFDISSLKQTIFTDIFVSRQFVKEIILMCNHFGYGFVLPELSGFGTFVSTKISNEKDSMKLGFPNPHSIITIRDEIKEDNYAGDNKNEGEVGHICFKSPQIFMGYYKDEVNTMNKISIDKWFYTGFIGKYNDNGLQVIHCDKNKIQIV